MIISITGISPTNMKRLCRTTNKSIWSHFCLDSGLKLDVLLYGSNSGPMFCCGTMLYISITHCVSVHTNSLQE
jgi:hypothetical protein